MIFEQVLQDDLGCASYFLADGGEAVVVDPRFDIDVYLELAERHDARIAHVVDTHDHADHVSGRGRLARATGAATHRAAREGDSREGDLRPGDELHAGAVTLRALATPGHRPEHLSLVVTDTARSPHPCLVLSGDSLLVGDVARPDLAVDAAEGAAALHASLRDLLALGDHVELWPAHTGGSLCGGGAVQPKTSSTIGLERRLVGALELDERAFVESVGVVAKPKPPAVQRIAALNQGELTEEPTQPRELDPAELARAVTDGVTVLDVRASAEYDEAFIHGSLNIPRSTSGLGTRAGWAIGEGERIVVVAEDTDRAASVAGLLHAAGLWNVAAVAGADSDAWLEAGIAVGRAESIDIDDLARGLVGRELDLVDVRDPEEWRGGHVDGSVHLPLPALGDGRAVALPEDVGARLAVACKGGGRAALGASLLRRSGAQDVVRVVGGGVPDLPPRGVALSVG